ncbi:MAG: hypothetical protein ABSA46_16720 [Thermodesulfovibrionales bacterium]
MNKFINIFSQMVTLFFARLHFEKAVMKRKENSMVFFAQPLEKAYFKGYALLADLMAQ